VRDAKRRPAPCGSSFPCSTRPPAIRSRAGAPAHRGSISSRRNAAANGGGTSGSTNTTRQATWWTRPATMRRPSRNRRERAAPRSAIPAALPTRGPRARPSRSGLPPPKPEPVWSVENPCPACEPFKELMEVHLAAAQDAESKAASLESELARNAAEQEAVRARIAQLQEQLRMLEGQGGSAYDPATG